MTRKRQRERKYNALEEEYKTFSFELIESSSRPGSPHRFFESSYNCTFTPITLNGKEKKTLKHSSDDEESEKNEVTKNILTREKQLTKSEKRETNPLDLTQESSSVSGIDHGEDYDHIQVVHRHANGLCVVTAGTLAKRFVGMEEKDNPIEKIEFKISPPDPTSLGGKRKKKAKVIKTSSNKNEQPGLVKPSDTIATITFRNRKQLHLKSCVYGTVLELNTKLTTLFSGIGTNHSEEREDVTMKGEAAPSLLISDPLLDGYLAVILPSGPFPFCL